MMLKKVEMINYMKKRNIRVKFDRSGDDFTFHHALIKAEQWMWKIKPENIVQWIL